MAKPLMLVEALATGNDSGLGRHVRLFVKSLAALREDAEIRVVLPRGTPPPPKGIRAIRVPTRPYRLFCEVIWPAMIVALRPKAVLCLGQTLPVFRPPSRYGLLVPDVAPLEDLPFSGSGHPAFNRRWMQTRIPMADTLITSTGFTRRRLRELLGIPEARVHVVPPVEGFSPISVSGKMGASRPPYFLSIGNVEPRKNYPGLLQAYALARLKAELPPLHVLGHEAWGREEARMAALQLGLGGQVFFHGHVTEAERLDWLGNCRAFIASSLYEGFGLPLFEALSAGKACLYHGDTAQGEFAADCALAIDCSNPEALATGLIRLAGEDTLRTDLESKTKNVFAQRWAGYSPGADLRKAVMALLG